MHDPILEAFLIRQYEEGMDLARGSEVLSLAPLPSEGSVPNCYLATFRCRGMVRQPDGEIAETDDEFRVGIAFPPDYLRTVRPEEITIWLGPAHVWHPNIAPPFICLGRVHPATHLVDLLYQSYEVITYQKVTMREDDALNVRACPWVRGHQHLFPLDRRALKRRSPGFRVVPVEGPSV